MKHCTTIEQSKKLLELGLSRDTADMFYSHKTVFYNMMEHRLYVDQDDNWHLHQRSEIAFMDIGNEILCWSLGALLDVMPKCIVSHNTAFEGEDAEGINTTYYKHLEVNEKNIWQCSYKDNGILKDFEANIPLEAAFNMVVYLLENGFIKKEPKTSSE